MDNLNIEQRIVCFIDILGFGNYIEKFNYSNDITIVLEMKKSFEDAIKTLKDRNNNPGGILDSLEHKTFSDNVLISIPYQDSDNSFITRFNLIAMYARSFQFSMMQKGFFTRGGLSMGSYYSDDNIVFSRALVNAYRLESRTAIYPRIVIDNAIIKRIHNSDPSKIKKLEIDNYIIFDWENIAFLNSYNFIDAVVDNLNGILNDSDLVNDDKVLFKKIEDDSNGKLTQNFIQQELKRHPNSEKENI